MLKKLFFISLKEFLVLKEKEKLYEENKESIENFECEFNKTEIIGMMRDDGFGELNWEVLKENLNKISRECLDSRDET